MRKIEAEMCNAILAPKNYKNKNTEVEIVNNVTNVYLHGHRIASFTRNNPGESVLEISLCGWNTQTTRSRINAVLHAIYMNSSSLVKYNLKTKNSDAILEAVHILKNEKSTAIIDSHTHVHINVSTGMPVKLTNSYDEPVKCFKSNKFKKSEGIFKKFM